MYFQLSAYDSKLRYIVLKIIYIVVKMKFLHACFFIVVVIGTGMIIPAKNIKLNIHC